MIKVLAVTGCVLSVLSVGLYIFSPKPVETVREVIREQLGAIPGNSVEGDQFVVGGVDTRYVTQEFRQATTTPCALQNPTGTSTIIAWQVDQRTATGSAIRWTVATSTTAFATTTQLYERTLPASVVRTFGSAGTTTAAGMGQATLGASQWLVVEAQISQAGGGYVPFNASNGPSIFGTCSMMLMN